MSFSRKSKLNRNKKSSCKCSQKNASNSSTRSFPPQYKSKGAFYHSNLNKLISSKISPALKNNFLIFALKSKDNRNNSKTTSLKSKLPIKRLSTTRDRSKKKKRFSRISKNTMKNTPTEGKVLVENERFVLK